MGLGHPWRIRVIFGRDDSDAKIYGSATTQRQYYRSTVAFDPNHESMTTQEDGDLAAVVRHELAHVLLSPLTSVAENLVGDDPKARKLLEDAEDEVATLLERMPVWAETV